jgi:hypothetical protein
VLLALRLVPHASALLLLALQRQQHGMLLQLNTTHSFAYGMIGSGSSV